MTSYAYLKRFLKEEKFAVLGGVLYAFSGFSAASMMYYHFHDIVALFPSMLLGLEKMVEENKKGIFAIAVAVNALVNYVFFVGEVIFVIAYFVIRFLVPDVRTYAKKIVNCFIEGILGVGMSAILFFPSVFFVLSNPRVSNSLNISQMLTYGLDRYLQLIKAFFIPADAMRAETAIMEFDYSTCEAWIPLFGCCLAIAFVIKNRKHWLSKMLVFCLVIAFVPVLNSAFYMFNADYYARWFYMMILIVVLATVKMLESREYGWMKKAGLASGIFTIIFAVVIYKYGTIYHKYMFIGYVAVALFGYGCVWIQQHLSWRILGVCVSLCILISQTANIYQMKKEGQTADYMMNRLVKTSEGLVRSETPDYRIQYYWPYWNGHLIEDDPIATSFTSTISGSIFEFYDLMELPRIVVSKIPGEYTGVQALLSVKYYIDTRDLGIPYVKHFNNGMEDVYIYEKDTFIPMGFSYDTYITEKDFKEIPAENRHYILMKAIVVEDEDEASVSKILRKLSSEEISKVGSEILAEDIQRKRENTVNNFSRSSKGFSSEMDQDEMSYVFFSVPYDKGWRATVNGEPVEIVKAEGFMTVGVEAGHSDIVFSYMTPGLVPGMIISVAAWGIWLVWIICERKKVGHKCEKIGGSVK